MSDQSNSETVIPSAPVTEAGKPEDQRGLNGQNVLSLLHQATDLAGGNSRYAVEIVQKLSDQLGLAKNKVQELEARIAEL